MKPLLAFLKKEFLDTVRTGRLMILLLIFALFGIMSPAIAKLTPWMMEMMADTMAQSGLVVTDVQVDAMTSWAQFFKNMPLGLIAFVLIFSDIFTKEYKSGTLLLVLTKGLARYKVVLAKAALMMLLWSGGYWMCFGITYGYNAWFWDNSIANNLATAAGAWWLFGAWVICLMVLFSALTRNNMGVCLCTGAAVILSYVLGLLPAVKPYAPTALMGANSLLAGAGGADTLEKAAVMAAALGITCVAASIPIMNKKQL